MQAHPGAGAERRRVVAHRRGQVGKAQAEEHLAGEELLDARPGRVHQHGLALHPRRRRRVLDKRAPIEEGERPRDRRADTATLVSPLENARKWTLLLAGGRGALLLQVLERGFELGRIAGDEPGQEPRGVHEVLP